MPLSLKRKSSTWSRGLLVAFTGIYKDLGYRSMIVSDHHHSLLQTGRSYFGRILCTHWRIIEERSRNDRTSYYKRIGLYPPNPYQHLLQVKLPCNTNTHSANSSHVWLYFPGKKLWCNQVLLDRYSPRIKRSPGFLRFTSVIMYGQKWSRTNKDAPTWFNAPPRLCVPCPRRNVCYYLDSFTCTKLAWFLLHGCYKPCVWSMDTIIIRKQRCKNGMQNWWGRHWQ